MRTIQITDIPNVQFNKYKLKEGKIPFSAFMELVRQEVFKENLDESLRLSKKAGLSDMTMADIDKEVKAVRRKRNAKNHS